MSVNRLDDTSFDARLHLLDRQVVDDEGLMVCKVDDLEVSWYAEDRPPAVTRILTGPAALWPRMSGRTGHWLRRRWISLGVQYADRDVPLAVPLELVRSIGSAVELTAGRDGLLDRQPAAPEGVTYRRMGELLGMRVQTEHPDVRGKVLDVRLRPREHGYELDRLLVAPGRPGSMLGYERGGLEGPWMVRSVVRHLHRHARLVPLDAVEEIDWDAGRVRIAAGARVAPADPG